MNILCEKLSESLNWVGNIMGNSSLFWFIFGWNSFNNFNWYILKPYINIKNFSKDWIIFISLSNSKLFFCWKLTHEGYLLLDTAKDE